VAGEERALAAPHVVPALDGLLGRGRLAVGGAVELEDGVAAEHERVLLGGGDLERLGHRQLARHVLRAHAGDRRLVDAADDDRGVEAGGLQQSQAGGGGGGEDEAARHHRPCWQVGGR
jgi:hypothetical protein